MGVRVRNAKNRKPNPTALAKTVIEKAKGVFIPGLMSLSRFQ
jgi:hypothetical protein